MIGDEETAVRKSGYDNEWPNVRPLPNDKVQNRTDTKPVRMTSRLISMGNVRAIVYVDGTLDHNTAKRRCLEHCEARGYRLVSIVEETDDDVSHWRGAFAALAAGAADVLVVATRGDLPRDELPRIEVAGEGSPTTVASQRRPQRASAPPTT